jgi:hypothetical protein
MVLLKINLKDMACTFIKFSRTANAAHCGSTGPPARLFHPCSVPAVRFRQLHDVVPTVAVATEPAVAVWSGKGRRDGQPKRHGSRGGTKGVVVD